MSEESSIVFNKIFQRVGVISMFDSKCKCLALDVKDIPPITIDEKDGVPCFDYRVPGRVSHDSLTSAPMVLNGKNAGHALEEQVNELIAASKGYKEDNISPALTIIGMLVGLIPEVGTALSTEVGIMSLVYSVQTTYDLRQSKQVKYSLGNQLSNPNDPAGTNSYQAEVADINLNQIADYVSMFDMLCVIEDGVLMTIATPNTLQEIDCFYAYKVSRGEPVPEGEDRYEQFFKDYDALEIDAYFNNNQDYLDNDYDAFHKDYMNSQNNASNP